MAFTVPTSEPSRFRAGDSLIFKRGLSDYSAVDWTLTYYLRGPQVIDVPSTADGTSFSVSVSAATTAAWQTGSYRWQAVVVSGSEKHTVGTGWIEILPNLAVVNDQNYDGRSKARIALECIEAVLSNTATRQQEEYELDGVRIKDKPIAELIRLRDHYKRIVDQEDSREAIESGRQGKKNIYYLFK
jgi:hypothetical protein